MPRVNFTDAFCRSAKAADGKLTEYADLKERGLSLRVTPAGVKSWTLRYRNQAGEQKRISLGRLDDVSLVKARAAAAAERVKVHAGDDPAKARKVERQRAVAASKLETVQEIGERYFTEAEMGRHRPNARKKRESTLVCERRYFDNHIAKPFGSERLADLTRARIHGCGVGLCQGGLPMSAPEVCILGVDPGASGAIAFYFPSHPGLIAAEDVPLAGGDIDAATLAKRIRQMAPTMAVVEQVGAMPKQGVSSTFKFGCAYGVVRGVIAALDVPMHLVTPGRWCASKHVAAPMLMPCGPSPASTPRWQMHRGHLSPSARSFASAPALWRRRRKARSASSSASTIPTT